MLKGIFILLFICLGYTANLKAQYSKASVEGIEALYDSKEDAVKVTFTIVNASASEVFDVRLDAYKGSSTTSGEKINIMSCNGDVIGITGNGRYTINWHQRKDGYVLDEFITFKILLAQRPNISYVKHIGKSLLFPGLGDLKVGNYKWPLALGAIGYGAIGSAIYLNSKANTSYNNYKNSFDIANSNSSYNNAVKQNKNAHWMGAAAIFVWSVDIAMVANKVRKAKSNLTPEKSAYYHTQSQQRKEFISKPIALNTKDRYDLAIEKGDNAMASKNYAEAKAAFLQALEIKPNDNIAKTKLNEASAILAKEEQDKAAYQTAITEAASLMEQNKFHEAKTKYQLAAGFQPNNPYPNEQIAKIDNILAKQERERTYKEAIANGDSAFKRNDFETAKAFYQSAFLVKKDDLIAQAKIKDCEYKINLNQYNLLVKKADENYKKGYFEEAKRNFTDALVFLPDDDYVSNKIIDCTSEIKKIETKKAENSFDVCITKANAAFDRSDYDLALVFYNDALTIFPDKKYPQTRISVIKDMFDRKIALAKSNKVEWSEIREKCTPGVILILDIEYNYFNREYEPKPVASGFFFTSDGYGITNKHVYDALRTKGIAFSGNGEAFEIVNWFKMDDNLDYAIFKVKKQNNQQIVPLTICNEGFKVTDEICIIGNPNGLNFSFKNGSISSIINSETFEHQAPTDGGSSGSPIINNKGEVIGLHHSGLKGKGQNNFATDIRLIPLYLYK